MGVLGELRITKIMPRTLKSTPQDVPGCQNGGLADDEKRWYSAGRFGCRAIVLMGGGGRKIAPDSPCGGSAEVSWRMTGSAGTVLDVVVVVR